MDEFIKEAGTLHFWFAVVLVGIVLHVVGGYFKALTDRIISSFSTSWRRRSETAKVARANEIDELRKDGHKQLLMLANEMRHRLRAIIYVVMAMSVLIISEVRLLSGMDTNAFQALFRGAAVGMIFLMMSDWFRAMDYRRLVAEAKDE